jgi:hypothetical protein
MQAAQLRGSEAWPFAEGGFQFENTLRNARLEAGPEGGKLPKAHKTGTTIVGVVFKDGIVLGADTRATSNTVVDKNCAKIHYVSARERGQLALVGMARGAGGWRKGGRKGGRERSHGWCPTPLPCRPFG